MNQKLRKIHLISWVTLGVLLPLGFIATLLVIPKKISQREIFRDTPAALPQVITWVSEDNFIAALRVDEKNENYQLELIITRPFQAPNLLVYLFTDKEAEINAQLLLGTVKSKGTLRYAIPKSKLFESQAKIGFYDPLHKKLVSTIQFRID